MQNIYTARDEMDAHFVQGLLEQEGIESVIQGEPLGEVWGTLPLSDRALPSIWVNEPDVPKAEPIVAEYRQRLEKNAEVDEAPPRTTWKCPNCGEEVEEQFDTCWNCGAAKPGTEPATPEASPGGPA